MIRLILSILAGMIVTTLLSTATDLVLHFTGIYPPFGEPLFDTGLLTLSTAYRFFYQVLGGWITARIAQEQESKALWIMGIIGAILWMAGTLAMPDMSPLWYGVVGALLSIPSVMIGGRLAKRP
jgi:hypothetical protein